MFWLIAMSALRGVEGRRRSCNLPSQCCLLSFSSDIECFFKMTFVSTTATKFPFWKELWNLFAYEINLCLASQKPSEREFFLPAGTHLGVKLLRLRPLLYPGAKKR
jgi:hypothetical protein